MTFTEKSRNQIGYVLFMGFTQYYVICTNQGREPTLFILYDSNDFKPNNMYGKVGVILSTTFILCSYGDPTFDPLTYDNPTFDSPTFSIPDALIFRRLIPRLLFLLMFDIPTLIPRRLIPTTFDSPHV